MYMCTSKCVVCGCLYSVQRFHAVLELKNELAQLAACVPLLTHPKQGPPGHLDSLDTSHNTSEHQLPRSTVPQRTPTPFTAHQDAASVSSHSIEQGDGSGGVGEREEDEIESDYSYRATALKQLSQMFGVSNLLHSKSRILLSSGRPQPIESVNRYSLSDIAENETAVASLHSPGEERRRPDCVAGSRVDGEPGDSGSSDGERSERERSVEERSEGERSVEERSVEERSEEERSEGERENSEGERGSSEGEKKIKGKDELQASAGDSCTPLEADFEDKCSSSQSHQATSPCEGNSTPESDATEESQPVATSDHELGETEEGESPDNANVVWRIGGDD